jgi:hypothetical protein
MFTKNANRNSILTHEKIETQLAHKNQPQMESQINQNGMHKKAQW